MIFLTIEENFIPSFDFMGHSPHNSLTDAKVTVTEIPIGTIHCSMYRICVVVDLKVTALTLFYLRSLFPASQPS